MRLNEATRREEPSPFEVCPAYALAGSARGSSNNRTSSARAGETRGLACGIATVDADVSPLDVAQVAQSLLEPSAIGRDRLGRHRHEVADREAAVLFPLVVLVNGDPPAAGLLLSKPSGTLN